MSRKDTAMRLWLANGSSSPRRCVDISSGATGIMHLMAQKANTVEQPSGRSRNLAPRKSPQPGARSHQQGAAVVIALRLIALSYALIAGLRTVGDMDIGWQLATGRWIVQHHSIPSTDVLSFTARSQEWIYPVLSQVVLYGSYVIGGYALLSWLAAAACVGTIALLLRRGSVVTALLAIIAVPLIAARTAPRADMFTEVLFAAFLSVLWHYHRSGRGPLWLLPVLMCVWTNLHLGFIAGLGVCAAYVALELGEAAIATLRPAAVQRLRRATPWLAVASVATILNPWGARIYVAVARQGGALGTHSKWIGEWSGLRFTPARLTELFALRDPNSGLWWLILVAIVAAVVAAYRRRIALALLLAASTYIVIHAVRMKAPFAAVVAVIGGAVLADAIRPGWLPHLVECCKPSGVVRAEAVTFLFLAAMVLFATVRVADLVTQRYYLATPEQFTSFGAGPSYWFPTEAATFMLRERPPGNVFNDYNSGGFLTWALSPSYADYIDGRAIPFGEALFLHAKDLLTQPLDSPEWQAETKARNLNTVFVSMDHELSASRDALPHYCTSRQWRPVYLDTHAAIFVRVAHENGNLLARLQIDCNNVRFDHPPQITGSRSRAEAFHYHLNAGYILLALWKPAEALQSLDRAGSIFPDNAFLHFARGDALKRLGRWREAEAELNTASELGSESADLALATEYEKIEDYTNEMRSLRHAAQRSNQPYWLYLRLGYAQLASGQPREALISFDRAEKESPFVGKSAVLGKTFLTQLEEGRRRARQGLNRK